MRWGFVIIVIAIIALLVFVNKDTLFADKTPEPIEQQTDVTTAEPDAPETSIEDKTTTETSEPEVTQEESEEETEEEAAEEEPVEEAPVVEEEPANTLQNYLAGGSKKYNGYGYLVDEIGVGPMGIAARNELILLKFERKQNLDNGTVDTVLLIRENQTARGTCLGIGCASSYNGEYDVNFTHFNPVTIIDYIEQYMDLTIKDERDSVLISDHDAVVVELQNGVMIHVDRKVRFPLLVQDKDERELKKVQNVYFETVPQDELTLYTKNPFQFSI